MDWPLLQGLPPDDARRVLSAARRRRFKAGEIVFHEGDPGDTVHLIAQGRMAVRVTTPRGDTATVNVLGPGQVFGELALLSQDARRSATVVALEKSESLTIDRATFMDLERVHPSVNRFLAEVLASRVRQLSNDLLEALFVPADTRIVRRLLTLADLYGGREPGTVVPLTQEDLATLAGTSRATVNRVLRAAEEAGAVKLSRSRVALVDPTFLARRAR